MVDAQVMLFHAAGLHARPVVTLTKLAKTFDSHIHVAASAEGPWTDAKSVVKLMRLKTPTNTQLYFRAEGDDADAALAAIVALVNNDFLGGPE
jgi:phosphocarrier protein